MYSGRSAEICNPGDEAAKGATFLRGRQITDANGVVSFLSVYPGWYPGRALHIHLLVVVGDQELLVTQLMFDDSLNDLEYQGHPDCAGRPRHSALNKRDFVFLLSDVKNYTLDVEVAGAHFLQADFTIGVNGARP